MSTRTAGPIQILTAASMAATVKSAGYDISQLDNVSIQVSTTNTDGVGAWSIEGSNIEIGPRHEASTTDADWVRLTLNIDDPPNSASANESFTYQLNQLPYKRIRLVWTRTSGSAVSTINAWLYGKGL
jgi:hypothetical protein